MNNFSDRLKVERERLGLSQEEFGALGGVKKLAQFNYEKGERSPDADYIAALAKHGVDTYYLLTGDKKIEYSILADIRRAQMALREEGFDLGVKETAAPEYIERKTKVANAFELLDEPGKLAVESMIAALLTKNN